MKNLSYFLFVLISAISCKNNLNEQQSTISLSWELVSDVDLNDRKATCSFTLVNKGTENIQDGWVLYFNQSPRHVVSTESPFTVEHISGDWFRAIPQDGFNLSPGDSTKINYTLSYFALKESDAALAPYLVFGDQENGDIVVPSYEIRDFQWMKNINQNVFSETIPSPENRYKKAASLSLLPSEQTHRIIPAPVELNMGSEEIILDETYAILYAGGLENEANFLKTELKNQFGITTSSYPMASSDALSMIALSYDEDLGAEAYILTVEENNIAITGGDKAGVFYGIQSLLQLPDLKYLQEKNGSVGISVGNIKDSPRFKYRGLHIDVARNFQSIDQLKKMIKLAAHYKLNQLQFVITEDEAWRIEIPGLPELTEIGSKRGHTLNEHEHLHPSYGSGPFVENDFGSGYYTREEYIDFVAFAKAHYISIIPTINFPAHARSAIKAMETRYRTFIEKGDKEKANEYRLIDPQDTSKYYSAQMYKDNVVNVSRSSIFNFYDKVISEVAKMHEEAGAPIDIFHSGGDEVPGGAWSGSPESLALMDELPEISDPRNFQTYFFRKAVKMLNEKNMRIGAWQEAVFEKGGNERFNILPEYAEKDVIPYVWMTLGEELDLGYRMANLGYKVVLCNVQNFYFDLAYDPDPKEPGLYWGGYVDTKAPWEFAPLHLLETVKEDEDLHAKLEKLDVNAVDNIIGVQAQLWGETIKGPQMLEYYTLPKLVGFSEKAWSQPNWEKDVSDGNLKDQEWNRFANSIGQKALARPAYLFGGFNYRVPLPGAMVDNGVLKANVIFPGLTIRYTLDGSEPTEESPIFENEIEVNGLVKLKTFDQAGNSSRTVALN